MANLVHITYQLKLFSPLLGPVTSPAEHSLPLPGASGLLVVASTWLKLCLCLGQSPYLLPSFQLASSYLSFHLAGFCVRPSQGCSLIT